MNRNGLVIHRRIVALAAAFMLAAGGCSAGSPSATTLATGAASSAPIASVPASTATPTPSPTPTVPPATSSSASFSLLPIQQPAGFVSPIRCTGSIGASDPVAIVQLHAAVEGTGPIVLRDYASAASPRTACTFDGGRWMIAQLIDARHVVINWESPTGVVMAVVDLPEGRYHWFHLPSVPEVVSGQFVAVSPGLGEVAWLSSNNDGTNRQAHLTTSAGDRVIANLRPVGGRCGWEGDSKQGEYTRSGSHLFILDQPIPQDNTLIVMHGSTQEMSLVPPVAGWPAGASPGMAVWSPTSEALFYHRSGDIWRWTSSGGAEPWLRGVDWYHATISADGRHLAYAVVRSDHLHDVYLVDLEDGGRPQVIGKGARNLPVFLNNTQLWYKTEGEGVCGPGTDKPLIYNLTDGSEAASVIDWVLAVWPATSSNF